MTAPGDRPLSPSPSALEAHTASARRLGPFRLESVAGAGPISVVFKAWNAEAQGQGEPVALHVPRMELQSDSNFQRLYLADCASARTVRHPSVAPLVAAGQDLGLVWRAQSWTEGWDLERVLRRSDEHGRPADLPLILALGVQLCQGLVALHERADPDGTPAPLMHGHIGLNRAFVRVDGRAMLLGVPSPRGRANTGYGLLPELDASELAPEQLRQSGLGPRTDLYQLGLLLYTVWAGTSPFLRRTRAQTASAVALGVGPLARGGDLPPSMRGLFESVLSVDPAGRPASARQLLAALESAASATGRADPVATLKQRLAQLFPDGIGAPVNPAPLLARDEVRRLLMTIDELHEDRSPALVPIPELPDEDELDITQTVRILPADEPTVRADPVLLPRDPDEATEDDERPTGDDSGWDTEEKTDIFRAPALVDPLAVAPRISADTPPEFIVPGDLLDEAPTEEARPAQVRLGASGEPIEPEPEPDAAQDEEAPPLEVEARDDTPPAPPPMVRLPRATMDQPPPQRPRASGGRAVWLAVLGVGCLIGLVLGLVLWPSHAPRPSAPPPAPAPAEVAARPAPVAAPPAPIPEPAPPEAAAAVAPTAEPPAEIAPVAAAPPSRAPAAREPPEASAARAPREARSTPELVLAARSPGPEATTISPARTRVVAPAEPVTSVAPSPAVVAPSPAVAAPSSAPSASPELADAARPHLTDLQVSTSGDTVTLRGRVDGEGARPLGFLLEDARGSRYVIRYKGVGAAVQSRDQSLGARVATGVHVQESGGDTTITIDLAPSVEVTPRLQREATGFELTLEPVAIP